MPIYQLPPQPIFPDPRLADPSGLLGVGGDLSPERLLEAYRTGIFPWYSVGQPILWWSPDPRMVLPVAELRVGRSLRKRMRQRPYRLSMDLAFDEVVTACSTAPRPGQDGTWITPEIREGYRALHRLGHAHSVEAWDDEDRLVGGLYGVAVGRLFAGESMFATSADASKVAFVALVRQLDRWGFPLVDCQMHTPHLATFGAREVPRDAFLAELRVLTRRSGRIGPWAFEGDPYTETA
jgi:leucyl/phenylalanyl-tRNA--protein transferase